MAVSTSIWEAAQFTLLLIKTYLGEDDKVNTEIVHDATEDIDAASYNKIVSGLAEVGLRTRPGNPVKYSFTIANLTDAQTDLVLQMVGNDALITAAAAMRACAVVGIAWRLENAQSAGDLIIDPRIAGVKITPLKIDETAGSSQKGRANQLPAAALAAATGLGAALDDIDCVVTTANGFAAGATPSLLVDVFVSYGGEHEAL